MGRPHPRPLARTVVTAAALVGSVVGVSHPVTEAQQINASDALSPTQRFDPPPEGVDQLLSSYMGAGGGGGNCTIPPSPGDEPCGTEIGGQDITFIFTGIREDRPFDVVIQRPDGRVAEGQTFWTGARGWHAVPGDPYGEYAVAAVQDSVKVLGKFTIDPSSRPRVWVDPEDAPAGVLRTVLLAGWSPGQSVPLRLYGWAWRGSTVEALPGLQRWRYLTSLGTVTADMRGEAVATFPSSADDPEGEYRVFTDPPTRGWNDGGDFYINKAPGSPVRGIPSTLTDVERAHIVEAVDRANAGWISANQLLDPSALTDSMAGQELSDDLAELDKLQRQGRTKNYINTAFTLNNITLTAPGHAIVHTRETWYSETYEKSQFANSSGQDTSGLSSRRLLDRTAPTSYDETYTLEYRDGSWIVIKIETREGA